MTADTFFMAVYVVHLVVFAALWVRRREARYVRLVALFLALIGWSLTDLIVLRWTAWALALWSIYDVVRRLRLAR